MKTKPIKNQDKQATQKPGPLKSAAIENFVRCRPPELTKDERADVLYSLVSGSLPFIVITACGNLFRITRGADQDGNPIDRWLQERVAGTASGWHDQFLLGAKDVVKILSDASAVYCEAVMRRETR